MTTSVSATSPWDIPEDYKDRRVLLMVFGILLALGGLLVLALAGLMLAAMGFTRFAGSPAGSPTSAMQSLATIAFAGYAVAGILLITLGLGSMMLKRWSRPLILILSWLVLYSGVIGTLSLAINFNAVKDGMNAQMGEMGMAGADSVGQVMLITQFGFLFIFGLCLPAMFCLVYGLPSVRQTLERCDRKTRWTDRCPIPVLGLALGLALTAGYLALTPVMLDGLPLLGEIRGWSPLTIGVLTAVALVLAVAAWMCFRLRIAGWVLTLVLIATWGTEYVLTLRRLSPAELYGSMGLSEEDLAMMMMTQGALLENTWIWSAVHMALLFIFTACLFRYFKRANAPTKTAA